MAPLITLLVTFALAGLALRKRKSWRLAGRIAMAAMLVMTGVAHFTRTEALAEMVPPVLPLPVALVYVTGVAEFLFAAVLLLYGTPIAGWVLAAFFLALLPANVYSAVAEVGLGGHGADYLWFRVPLQLLFIGWTIVCTGIVSAPARFSALGFWRDQSETNS